MRTRKMIEVDMLLLEIKLYGVMSNTITYAKLCRDTIKLAKYEQEISELYENIETHVRRLADDQTNVSHNDRLSWKMTQPCVIGQTPMDKGQEGNHKL